MCFLFLKDVAQMQLVDREWSKQSIEEPCTYSDKQTDLDFWKERLSKSDLNGELKYGNLRKIVGCTLSLPFANALVERVFSSLKLIKTEHRNSLKRESLCGLLHSKEGLAIVGKAADQLELQHFPEMVRLLKNVNSTATDSEASIVIKEHLKF